MREVLNTTQSPIKVLLLSAYGKVLQEFDIESGESECVPLYHPRQKLIESKSKKVLYVYAGEGAIDIGQCYKKYDFSSLKAQDIDFYLQNESFPRTCNYQTRQKIKDFCAILELNAQSGTYVLLPPAFEKLEMEILCPI